MNVKNINKKEVNPINSTNMLDNEKKIDERITDKLNLGERSIVELICMQTIEESTQSTGERKSDTPTEGAMEESLRIFEGQPIFDPPRKEDNDSTGELALSSAVGPTPGSSKLEPEKVRKLKKGEVKRLQDLEKIVTEGAKSTVTAGRALYEIYSSDNGVLWRAQFSSFDLYCAEKWSYKKSQSYRLLKIGGFIADLGQSPFGDSRDWIPTNECQIRPLLDGLKKKQRVECWKQIVADVQPNELTGKIVQERVQKYIQENGLATEKPKPVVTRMERAIGEFQKLEAILSEFPNGNSYIVLVRQIFKQIRKDEAEVDAETLPPRKETPTK